MTPKDRNLHTPKQGLGFATNLTKGLVDNININLTKGFVDKLG